MENTKKILPLLLLLFLALIPRNSSAQPIVLEQNDMQSVAAVVGVTKALTEAIEWFQANMVNDSALHESITNLENQIAKLSFEVEKVNKDILKGLYRAQTRIAGTRSSLEEMSRHLKSQCEKLIVMYNRNDVSEALLSYSVKRFVKLARNTKVLLEEALEGYKETQDELSETKAILKGYNIKLARKEGEQIDVKKDRIKYLNKVLIWVGVGSIGLGPLGLIIAAPIINSEKSHLNRILDDINKSVDKVQATVADLLKNNDVIGKYISTEIALIRKWKIKLVESISDHQTGITQEELQYGKDIIIDNLRDLIKACINYLNHKSADISKEGYSFVANQYGKFNQ